MSETSKPSENKASNNQAISLIVKPALRSMRVLVLILVVTGVIANILTVHLPQQIAGLLDQIPTPNAWPVALTIFAIFGLAAFNVLLTTFVAQKLAYRMRGIVFDHLIKQPFRFVAEQGSGKLLSILTVDVDTIREVINQAFLMVVSAVVMLVGSSYVLFTTNWRLALASLVIVPLLVVTFGVVFSRIIKYFETIRIVGDNLNRVIGENIVAASLVRVLNTQKLEMDKLDVYNVEARSLGMKILKGFAFIIPAIGLISSLGTLIILYVGGNMMLQGELTLGQFVAFNTYLGMLIGSIMIISFISNYVARAFVALGRLAEVVSNVQPSPFGSLEKELSGEVTAQNIKLDIDGRPILKGVSLRILPKQRTAILGPTGSGKTQLMYLLSGLLKPTEGTILYDYQPLYSYSQDSFYSQVGVVFQDSVMFNATIRENVAFKQGVSEEDINRALKAADLLDFVQSLPEGLDTKVSERGSNLSGGQKQRLMLARALAANPRILFLDDFTARVDVGTETKIWENLQTMYPELTLTVITQKVSTAEKFDQVILLMEGELLANGTHQQLLETSLEYNQIVESQKSTNK